MEIDPMIIWSSAGEDPGEIVAQRQADYGSHSRNESDVVTNVALDIKCLQDSTLQFIYRGMQAESLFSSARLEI
jgi:hypothetical protein